MPKPRTLRITTLARNPVIRLTRVATAITTPALTTPPVRAVFMPATSSTAVAPVSADGPVGSVGAIGPAGRLVPAGDEANAVSAAGSLPVRGVMIDPCRGDRRPVIRRGRPAPTVLGRPRW